MKPTVTTSAFFWGYNFGELGVKALAQYRRFFVDMPLKLWNIRVRPLYPNLDSLTRRVRPLAKRALVLSP